MSADLSSPTVSVVIPVRNAASTLAAAIRSILDQEEPGVEVIVVDDGSNDGSADVAEGLATRGVRTVSQAAEGVGAARNRGAAEAAGGWLVFLDADDLALPGQLRSLRSAAAPGIGLVCGATSVVVGDGTERVEQPRITGLVDPFSPGTFLVARRVFDEAGGYETAIGFGENTELSIRLIDACTRLGLGVAQVETAVFRHLRDTSRGRATRYAARIAAATELMLERHATVLRSERIYVRFAATGGVAAGRARQWAAARRLLRAAARSEDARPIDQARYVVAHLPAVRNLVWRR